MVISSIIWRVCSFSRVREQVEQAFVHDQHSSSSHIICLLYAWDTLSTHPFGCLKFASHAPKKCHMLSQRHLHRNLFFFPFQPFSRWPEVDSPPTSQLRVMVSHHSIWYLIIVLLFFVPFFSQLLARPSHCYPLSPSPFAPAVHPLSRAFPSFPIEQTVVSEHCYTNHKKRTAGLRN